MTPKIGIETMPSVARSDRDFFRVSIGTTFMSSSLRDRSVGSGGRSTHWRPDGASWPSFRPAGKPSPQQTQWSGFQAARFRRPFRHRAPAVGALMCFWGSREAIRLYGCAKRPPRRENAAKREKFEEASVRGSGKGVPWTGCGTALVTPFDERGRIDLGALEGLVEWQIGQGVDFLLPCGTTGESATLSREERKAVTAAVGRAANRRLPV